MCTFVMLLLISCAYQNTISRESQHDICCQQCTTAFAHSPVGVGAEGVTCGNFMTGQGYELSKDCGDYFSQHPTLVAEC